MRHEGNFLLIYREWSVCSSRVVYSGPLPSEGCQSNVGRIEKEGGLLEVVAVATEGFTVWVRNVF